MGDRIEEDHKAMPESIELPNLGDAWQPIEQAPTDGDALVYCTAIVSGRFVDGKFKPQEVFSFHRCTHFMPLADLDAEQVKAAGLQQ